MSPVGQLPLALRFPFEQRFAEFMPTDAGEPALLREAVGSGGRAFLHGPAGCGKTHLLMACAAIVDDAGKQVAYLPMGALGNSAAAALSAQSPVDLICIDDLDAALAMPDVEQSLFALHNRQGDAGGAIVYAARAAPAALPLTLADLRSRLEHCLRLPVRPLDEEQRRILLVHRAKSRGLALEGAALDYLFSHVERDLGSLTAVLDRLDKASLAAQRRLSVPFLREVLGDARADAR